MRQRGAGGGDESSGAKGGGPARRGLAGLRRFDVYSKVHDDYRVETKSGGLISLCALAVMWALVLSELNNYLTADVVDHITVDTMPDQKLPIGVNITFPHLRCDEVSVDTVDSAGNNQVDVSGGLVKLNLDAQGRLSKGDRVASGEDCLSCMEATESDPERCCNTCGELKAAYMEAQLPYFHVLDSAPQCRDSVGCQVHGDVLVSKIGGNVHVALGRSAVRGGRLVHEFNIKDVGDGFNTSHIIHRLDFGERVRGVSSPLEGTTKIVKHGAHMFHYYIKLVPTLFSGSDRVVYTHQYSVTESEKDVMVRRGELAGLPGVFLVYEFTPFMVERTEKAVPFSHFMTSVCAIIGGVFTVAGMVDAALYRSSRGLAKASA